MIRMKDILTDKGTDVWSVGLDKTVFQALELMAEKEIGALLVMERDKVKRLSSAPEPTPNDTADQCMALMTEKRVRHLPVVNDGKVVGLISIGDVVKSIISEQQSTINVLETYITS